MNNLQQRGVILFVESSEDDVFLLGRALQEAAVERYLHVARSGAEALNYLKARTDENEGERLEWPEMVLVRGRLRDMDGVEILRWVRSEPGAGCVKVYVLGATVLELEIAKAHQEVANGYWLKPGTADEYSEFAHRIKERLVKS